MKIHTTVVVHIERRDGTSTHISETTTRDAGDNPRFEATEVHDAVSDTALLIDQRTLPAPLS